MRIFNESILEQAEDLDLARREDVWLLTKEREQPQFVAGISLVQELQLELVGPHRLSVDGLLLVVERVMIRAERDDVARLVFLHLTKGLDVCELSRMELAGGYSAAVPGLQEHLTLDFHRDVPPFFVSHLEPLGLPNVPVERREQASVRLRTGG